MTVQQATAPLAVSNAQLFRGLFWSVLSTLFAACYLIPYRYAAAETSRLTAMTAMLTSATIFNAIVALSQRRPWVWDRTTLTTAGLLAGFTVLANLTTAQSLLLIGAGMTSVVLKSQVVLTPIVSVWALGERASGRFWSGALVALAGVALPALIASDEGHSPLGYGLAFVAAVGFCGMQIVTRRVIHRIEPARVNAIRLVMAIGALQLLEEGRAAWSLSGQTWAYAAAAGVLGPGLSRLCLMTAVRYLSPSVIALVALIGPIFAFALGALFFGEAPSEWELLGAGLILLGIVWPLGASFRTKSDD